MSKPKTTSCEDAFEALYQKLSAGAATIQCSKKEYRDGLRQIIENLETDIETSEEQDDAYVGDDDDE